MRMSSIQAGGVRSALGSKAEPPIPKGVLLSRRGMLNREVSPPATTEVVSLALYPDYCGAKVTLILRGRGSLFLGETKEFCVLQRGDNRPPAHLSPLPDQRSTYAMISMD